MKDVIVSFSSKGREDYNRSLLRLIDSCKEHWSGDVLVYSPDHELSEYRGVNIHKGWPQPRGVKSFTHAEMPYQFKTCMIQLAREQGYERIIWLDSSMQLKKDLGPLFDAPTGITVFENLGHPTWKYLSDKAEKMLYDYGFSPGNIYDVPQIWGGAFALNFTDGTQSEAGEFFETLKEFSVNGSFLDAPGSKIGFVAHRHDQSVMSILLHNASNMLPYGKILCPPHDRTGEYGIDPYLVCRGL